MTSPGVRIWLPAVALVTLSLAACGGGSTGNGGGAGHGGTVGTGGSGGAGAAGHGGTGGGSGTDPSASFVGSWTFDSGSVTPTCTGVTVAAISLTGSAVTITKIDATHINFAFSNSELSCSVDFAVGGTTATAEAAQTCTINVIGMSGTFDVTAWTLTESGGTISMSVNGTANVSVVGCKPTGMGMLSRVDAAAG